MYDPFKWMDQFNKQSQRGQRDDQYGMQKQQEWNTGQHDWFAPQYGGDNNAFETEEERRRRLALEARGRGGNRQSNFPMNMFQAAMGGGGRYG